MERAAIAELEEVAFRAWPAAEVVERSGWRLRFTSGLTRRGNSVWPGAAAGGGPSLDERIGEAVAFYAERDCAPRFQIAPVAAPPELDAALAARGYRVEAPVSIQVAPAASLPATAAAAKVADLSAFTTEDPDDEWLSLAAGRSRFADSVAVYRGILDRLAGRAGFARARLGSETVAVGLGVRDGGWCGVFGMLTAPEARRRGGARAVLASLAEWGRRGGATRLYLQVERDNPEALALYRASGFAEAYGYHYRLGTT